MLTKIFVISGFLGSGKTTLIQKMLKEAFNNEKVVLIENDFGDISVDATLLKSGGIEVREINSGCICCSLSGDFIKALQEILDQFQPSKIIIEPSGVSKLSDIMEACSDPSILPRAKVKTKITVVDVKRCKMYLDNFGEFFEDQIQNADAVLLSRTEEFPDKINATKEIVQGLNPHAVIFSQPWDQIDMDNILHPRRHDHICIENHVHVHDCQCECGCHGSHIHSEHEHVQKHDHECCCNHNHAAEDVFDTVTIRTNRVFSIEDLKALVSNMEKNAKGTVLRAKGIVRGPNGYINLQYLHGDIKATRCSTKGDMVCIIGRNLNRQELYTIFNKE